MDNKCMTSGPQQSESSPWQHILSFLIGQTSAIWPFSHNLIVDENLSSIVQIAFNTQSNGFIYSLITKSN